MLRIHHDEDAVIYINGVEVGRTTGHVTEYGLLPIGAKALKRGKNVIAVHCKQTGGGQYIDVGVQEYTEAR